MNSSNISFKSANSKQITEDLERLKQELHEAKRNLETKERMIQDYKNEIESLESEEFQEECTYKGIIKNLQQEIMEKRLKQSAEKEIWEEKITRNEEKIRDAKIELNFYEGNDKDCSKIIDATAIIQEILADRPQLENQKLECQIKEFNEINESLVEKRQDYCKEIENLKRCLQECENELTEKESDCEFLSDEALCLKTEINSKKSRQFTKATTGNSMFAEVDDRRVDLENEISQMKTSYLTMIQQKNQLKHELKNVKLEILKNLEEWKDEICENNYDESRILKLKSQTENLEKDYQKCIEQLSNKPWFITKNEFQDTAFFEAMMNPLINEQASLLAQLVKKLKELVTLTKELIETKDQMRKSKLEAYIKEFLLEINEK